MRTIPANFQRRFLCKADRKVRPCRRLKALHVEIPEELEEGLDEAFATKAPVFLDVVTESETTELPPVYSWLRKARKEREEELP